MTTFTESGMTFGPFLGENIFRIEQSDVYRKVREGVRMAEFLLLHSPDGQAHRLWVVEAKSSSPRPETQPNFDGFVEQIREKLVNAFSLGWACFQQRHKGAMDELPAPFKGLDLSAIEVRFVLVIKGHKEAWLVPLREALKETLRPTVKTWALGPSSVLVINDEMARRHRLVT